MVELGLQKPRLAGGRAIMQHQVRTGSVQPAADCGADPLGAAGDQDDLSLHTALRR
jgi:hypothetical protein